MSIQLYSIEHAPRRLPVWGLIMDDLGSPSVSRIAKVLDVGPSTVYRWNQLGSAPRSAQLALFWLTRWGRSTIHSQASYDASVACAYVDSLKRDIARLEANVRHLSQLSTGAANDAVSFSRPLNASTSLLGVPR